MMQNEPTLEKIEDYHNQESREKRMVVWIVILSGLLIGALYSIVSTNSMVDDTLKVKTDIMKY